MARFTRTLFADTLRLFMPIAAGLIALACLTYVQEQQILRLGANEPQIGLADSVAAGIANGELPTDLAGGAPVSIESSAAPYIVLYDTNGAPIAGTGYLEGALPSIPLGVFDVARSSGEDRLTWQPEAGVREAIVARPVDDQAGTGAAYVMAGRSLAYTEQEESKLTMRAALGMIGVLAATLLACFLVCIRRSPR